MQVTHSVCMLIDQLRLPIITKSCQTNHITEYAGNRLAQSTSKFPYNNNGGKQAPCLRPGMGNSLICESDMSLRSYLWSDQGRSHSVDRAVKRPLELSRFGINDRDRLFFIFRLLRRDFEYWIKYHKATEEWNDSRYIDKLVAWSPWRSRVDVYDTPCWRDHA